jgi:DNA-binding NarL/FixJ family response regulator
VHERELRSSILLADDHVILRKGLARLLEQTGRYDVVAESSDGTEAVRLADQLKPNVVIMDIQMPGLSGIEATRKIHDASTETKVLMLSVHEGQQYVEDALRTGAAGYVVKTAGLSELTEAIDTVLTGRTFVSPSIAQRTMATRDEIEQSPVSLLTIREREVLKMVARGDSTKEIAIHMGISPRTVDVHRGRIMMKLGIHKAQGLVRFAIREGLVDP